MRFYKIETWSDDDGSIEKDITFCQGESKTFDTYDFNDEDSQKMLKIIQRLEAIETTRSALLAEEKALTETGQEITAPYEVARRKQEEARRRQEKEEQLRQVEEMRKKRKEEDEFQKGMKQSIIEWQRENRCKFPGFGC